MEGRLLTVGLDKGYRYDRAVSVQELWELNVTPQLMRRAVGSDC